MIYRIILRVFFVPLALLFVGSTAFAGPVYQTKSGVAINGYDPVGYFTQSKAVKGSKDYSLKYRGATWLFSSAENLSKFESDPERYEPKFGGHCAYAMSKDNGYIATTVPKAWSIVDDKLYLNYSLGIKDKWDKRQSKYIKAANDNWPNFE